MGLFSHIFGVILISQILFTLGPLCTLRLELKSYVNMGLRLENQGRIKLVLKYSRWRWKLNLIFLSGNDFMDNLNMIIDLMDNDHI
jgi:hypothetical protein